MVGTNERTSSGAAGIGLLRETVTLLDGSGGPRERAHAHTELGAALRRAGELTAARAALRLAVDLAHRSGATALEEQALAELRAAGGRPRRRLISGPGALTPSEHRIAGLAAAGYMNREIAEQLVVTVDTVEYHLRHAYRKLGIRSRAELGEALRTERASRPPRVTIHVVRGTATTVWSTAP